MLTMPEVHDLYDRIVAPTKALHGAPDYRSHLPEIMTLTETIAAHLPVPPSGWRWIIETMARADGAPSLAGIARDALVDPPRLYQGRMNAEECSRIAAAVHAYFTRAYGPMLRVARADRLEICALLRTPPEEDELTARYDRLLAPFPVAAPAGARTATADTPDAQPPLTVDAGPPSQRLRCSRCSHEWNTRTARPVRCPRCRAALRWGDAA